MPVTTWHHGLMADYWATVNIDAPEVDLYAPHLRSPVLDAGCGTGRLLAPLRERGLDVDGCDASADMVERARQRVPDATVWVSALHELDPPRRYASIVVCGAFGLGTTRDEDIEAIRRLHDALLPGGTLVLDNEEIPFRYQARDWNEPHGEPYVMQTRIDAVDEQDRCVSLTMRVQHGDLVEEHALTMRQWYAPQLVVLLEQSGFVDVRLQRGVDETIVAYVASRDGDLQPLHR